MKLWSIFSSMKTGLVLLGITALVSGIGTLISRDIYGTLWFKLLLALLCLNLIICSISRFKSTVNRSFRPQIPRNVLAVPRKISCEIGGTSEDLHEQLSKVLRTKGYRLYREATTVGWSFVALKHGLGYWGSFIVHIAIVIMIIGALLGTWGFSGSFMALNGDSVSFKDIQLDKGSAAKNYSVRINSVEDRFLANGQRDNWYTNISILQEGKELAQGTLSVNRPFTYDGVTYYQSTYADYAHVSVEINGEILEDLIPIGLTPNQFTVSSDFQSRFPLQIRDSDLYVRGLKLQDQPVIYLQIFSSGEKIPVSLKLSQGQSETVRAQYKITLTGVTNATGLRVKADPGVPVVWAGCGMLFLGVMFSFYWRPYMVSGVFRQQEQAGILTMGMPAGKMAGQSEAEFHKILNLLEHNEMNQ